MPEKAKIITQVTEDTLFCKFEILDDSIIWKEAKVELYIKCFVHDDRAINDYKNIFIKDFIIESYGNKFEVDLKDYWYYTYYWRNISIELRVEVKIDDAIFFDTVITEKIENEIGSKPRVLSDAKEIIDPKDNFNLLENIKAIPHKAKILVILFSIIGAIVIVLNMLLWIHDQIVGETQTFFYSHYNSDWDSNSPFFNALMTSSGIGAAIWFAIKMQLRKYMTFFFKNIRFDWKKDTLYKLSDIIWWKSRVDLKDVELRIVACNIENWQYERGSWTDTRTVSFREPVRALEIYKKRFDVIASWEDISYYLKDKISFEKMYRILYPKQMISSTHGIDIHWEVQLIHDTLIDQELIWDANKFNNQYFFEW